jgi:hypothetical protein
MSVKKLSIEERILMTRITEDEYKVPRVGIALARRLSRVSERASELAG